MSLGKYCNSNVTNVKVRLIEICRKALFVKALLVIIFCFTGIISLLVTFEKPFSLQSVFSVHSSKL